MDKMKLYETTLSYHAKGPSALTEAKREDPPFDNARPIQKKHKDEFGNEIKTKNIAKNLAKKGMKKVMNKEETIEALEALEAVYEEAIAIQEALEEAGVNIDELFALTEDEVDEGFQQMSKTKALIARRRAGRRKKLTVGYSINRNKFKR